MKKINGISVIMPTYNQAGFIRNAIESLLCQTHIHWELIIVNDGSTDSTEEYISEYLSLANVIYLKNIENKGLGAAINRGLEVASYDIIAYLPSDDYYYPNHLEILNDCFVENRDSVLLFTRLQPNIGDSAIPAFRPNACNGLPDHYSLQLVQTAHRKTQDRWMERRDGDRANLFELFWRKLADKGVFVGINETTCHWTSHSDQRHKMILENQQGSIWKYRQYYGVKEPMELKTSNGKIIDEEQLYGNYWPLKVIHPGRRPLKILLVGELSYNPERICALEELGHRLYGLWIRNPIYAFFAVGPLPFGNVADVPYENWQNEIRKIQPDVIYGLLNYQAVPLARGVMNAFPEIPFVWHFKEGPSFCRQHGIWGELIDLFRRADGKIYISRESRDWYAQFFRDSGLTHILDGDIPKIDYFTTDFSPKLSDSDGEIHTVVPGRMVGMEDVATLSKNRIHIHLYTENYHDQKSTLINIFKKAMGEYFHIHPHCPPSEWVREFSQYDAGWLHCFDSTNRGLLRNMGWNDLNLPCRMNTLAAAGLPMIQKNNTGHIVAMQSRIRRDDLGIFYKDFEDLARQLYDKDKMTRLATNVMENRYSFSFDHHAPGLIDFFRRVIDYSKTKPR
jgi:glycosyltransferase involved in cell wall biosynthesis